MRIMGKHIAVFLFLAVVMGSALAQSIVPTPVEVRLEPKNKFTYVAPPEYQGGERAVFQVNYTGFTQDAQTAFQFAVDIWSAMLNSGVTIRVNAVWDSLAPLVLGQASPTNLYRDFSGAPQSGTWYPVALAEKLAGGNLNNASDFEIDATFNRNFSNWYFGTDGNTPANQVDFVSVVLHELGHGLGFIGSMNVQGGQGSWGFGTGFPTVFDLFAENGAGQQLIDTNIFPNPSTQLAAQLTGGDIYFDGPHANTGNGGSRPELYAPNPWEGGSSYAHLDENVYPAGNLNSLMTPTIGFAEAIHTPGPVTQGMFEDMGWTYLTGIAADGDQVANQFELAQNYPNPFNPSTTIEFRLTQAQSVELSIFNLQGEKVRTLFSGMETPGVHRVKWDGRDQNGRAVTSGLYFYRLRSGLQSFTRKMMFLK